MPIKTEFFPEQKIIYETYEGKVTLKEILENKKDQVQIEDPSGFSLIVDMSHAELDMTPVDIDKMVDFFKGFRHVLRETRVALVAGGRSETALAYMYSEMIKTEGLGYEVEVFSTLKAAKSWVLKHRL